MANINLLPEELLPKRSFSGAVDLLSKVNIVIFTVFILVCLASASYYFLNTLKIKNLQNVQQNLENRIKSLELTEQRLMLAKDRLVKIKSVYEFASINKDIDVLKKLLDALPSTVIVSEASLLPVKKELSFVAAGSQDLSYFLASTISLGDFSSAKMTQFSYKPDKGYNLSLEIALKK